MCLQDASDYAAQVSTIVPLANLETECGVSGRLSSEVDPYKPIKNT